MKPILIAECCQNHNGNKEILKKQIHEAASNGADFVKIQAIRSKELTHRPRFDEGLLDENGVVQVIKRPFDAEIARLSKLDLSLDDEEWFVEECLRAGIAPMTTAFTLNGAREIKDMGYEAIKIASYDCASFPLLREVRKYWNNIFVSTGATYDNEIEKAAEVLKGTDFTFLHCLTIYPTPLEVLNLKRMNYLRRYTNKIGYSDHSLVETTGLRASKIAIALGASCIERHFTVLEKDQSKDGPVSINPQQLRELKEFINLSRYEQMDFINKEFPDWEMTVGVATRELSHAEKLNRDYFRGRFASIVNGKPVYNWEEELF
ncbi:MAG: N-acetylneuraminate synthase family protein [Rickettsiaceae bacterium]|nr:N-acetylneuraminate synthase family protein [Rickettsiaceae bacterium]